MWRPDLWLPIGRGRGWGEGVSGYGSYPACPLDGQADGRHRRSPRYSQRIGIEGMDSRPIEVCF